MTKETPVQGFITNDHVGQIAETFGKELADKVEAAEPGSTFLGLLFEDWRN